MILKNPYLSLGSTELSEHGIEINVTLGREQQDPTTFGDLIRKVEAGLKTANFQFRFASAFGASAIDKILYDAWDSDEAELAFEIRPTSGGRSATNPALTGTLVLNEFSPFSQSVGDFMDMPASFGPASDVEREVA